MSNFNIKTIMKKSYLILFIGLTFWSCGEETMNLKLFLDEGIGAESIHRTKDDGFIISTWPCLIIKTDSNLSF